MAERRGRRLGEGLGGQKGDTPVGAICRGTSIAYGRKREFCRDPHPAGRLVWGACWKCNRSLGCSTCTTTNETEILCQYCAAWGTVAAFHWHGPISNHDAMVRKRDGIVAPEFSDYPERFQRGYEHQGRPTQPHHAETQILLPSLKTVDATKKGEG